MNSRWKKFGRESLSNRRRINMLSTSASRTTRARQLLNALLGESQVVYELFAQNQIYARRLGNSRRRPPVLPPGMNYTHSEWNDIYAAFHAPTIQDIFALEEIAQKYMLYIAAYKLEN